MSPFVLLLSFGLLLGGAGSGWAKAPAARPAAPQTPVHRLRQVERALAARFGSMLGDEGVRASAAFAGGVQVRMTVAPAHDARGRLRPWSDREAQKILMRMRDEVARGFPDVRLLVSSGVELEPVPPARTPRVWTLRMLAPANGRVMTTAPGAGRAGSLLGAPEAPSDTPEAPPGAASPGDAMPIAPTAPAPSAHSLPPPPLDDSGGTPSPGAPAGARFGPVAAPAPAAPVELPAPEPALAPPPAPAPETPRVERNGLKLIYPDQPGGYGRGTYAASVGASLPTSVYRYPADNDALEWLIERELGDTLRATFKDARVHARIERPQVVRLDLEIAMTGDHRENIQHILHFTRDTTHGVFKQKFNLLRIHHKSRIRVTEADDRFSYDYRFHELTPYGHHDIHEEDPIFRPIRVERAFVIDVPRAFMLGRDRTAISAGVISRTVAPGLYANVDTSISNGYWVNFRRGFWERLEASLGYYSYSNELVPTVRGVFTPSEGSLSAVTFSARYRMPVEINGFAVALGLTHSFQPGEERRFYLPDDFERLYNFYVTGSRRVFENLLVHVAAKRSTITQKPDFEDNGLNTLGLGFEYVVAERAILMLELEGEKYDKETFANFGAIDGGDGLNVNAGAVVGTTLGDVEISARKLTEERQREINASVAYRW